MKKELRNQIEEFIEYNIELKRLSDENFNDKRKKILYHSGLVASILNYIPWSQVDFSNTILQNYLMD